MKPNQMNCPVKNWDDLEQAELEKLMFAEYNVTAQSPDKIHFHNKDTGQKLLTVTVPPWYYRVCKLFEKKQ